MTDRPNLQEIVARHQAQKRRLANRKDTTVTTTTPTVYNIRPHFPGTDEVPADIDDAAPGSTPLSVTIAPGLTVEQVRHWLEQIADSYEDYSDD